MKKTFILLAAMLTATLAFTQTTGLITGNLMDQSETGTSSGISVDVTLMNTGSQRCFVNGVGSLVREKQTYTAAQVLAGITLAKNSSIVCGSSTGQTRWKFSFKNSQLNTSRDCDLQITGNTSLDTATCLQAAATPTTTVPTSSLFLLLDGSNSMTGNLIPAVTATQSIGTSGARWNMFANTLNVASTLGVTGTSTLANVNLGAANTLSLSTIKQVSPTTALAVADNNGVSHFFISGTAPFNNTFLSGNGSGAIFLGQLALANVADTTGKITTAGGLALQNTSQLLPATIANDASGGVTTTSNGGNSLQWNNSGVLIVNPAATSSGAALTVGGISPTTGGASIFIGASGSANEVGAIYPADGSTAKFRARGLSIRNLSAGLLTGTEVFAISSSGVVTGGTLTGTTTGNTVSVLNAQGVVAALTGNSADQVVYTFTLLANTVDTTSKGILITCGLTHSSGTANPSVKININGVAAVTGSIGTAASQSVTTEAKILRTASTTGSSIGKATSSGNIVPFSQALAGLAWTSNQTITCTFNVANTDQMTGVAFWVEQVQ